MNLIQNKATYQYPRGKEHRDLLAQSVRAMLARLSELYGAPRMKDVPRDVSWLEVIVRDLYPEVPPEWLGIGEAKYAVEVPVNALEKAQEYIEGRLPDFVAPPNGGMMHVRRLTAAEMTDLFTPSPQWMN